MYMLATLYINATFIEIYEARYQQYTRWTNTMEYVCATVKITAK